MTAETDDQPAVFTESDRELLSEIRDRLVEARAFLDRLEPYLPLLERARTWLDRNPAAKWRQRHAVPQDRER